MNSSPLNILRSMRGEIVDARIAHPGVLHLVVRDTDGDLWRFATQDADWSPADPGELVDRAVEQATIEELTGELRFHLSGGSTLAVKPAATEAEDDPPNWELISPTGVALEFGPGVSWRVSDAGA